MNHIIKITYIFLFAVTSLYSQYDDRKFSISVNGVYTTSAKIYLTPFSSDPVIRNNAFPLSDIFNPAIEFKYRLSEPLVVGVSFEYMTASGTGPNLTVDDNAVTRTIVIEDGFNFYPVELSVYYILPFSTELFKFQMGGGAGYYFGEHVRKAGDVSVSNLERRSAYGIHVSAGVDYLLIPDTFLHFEMKFRDPQFTVKSRYSSQTANYEGRRVRIFHETFDSKINIDGITFLLGLTYQF